VGTAGLVKYAAMLGGMEQLFFVICNLVMGLPEV